MLSIVTFKWGTKYAAEHVNRLASMVRRNYGAHRMICVTNDAAGIDPAIEIVPDRMDFADMPSPHGGQNPSCYRRLRLFAPDAGATFGERIVSIDLDTVIVGNMAPLWDRDEDFVAWQDPFYPTQYCGSMWLLRAGTQPQVWTGFNPTRSPSLAKAAGFRGSDQAWISYAASGAPTWKPADGAMSYRVHARTGLPAHARVIFFHGAQKPWMPEAQQQPWIAENWR